MGPSAWTRFRSLPADERRLRFRALGLLARFRIALLLLPFDRVRRSSEARAACAPSLDGAAVDRAIRSAARFVPGATCLVRALAARALLGPGARLVLGVGRDGSGEFAAHAWVEAADGRVVAERGDPALVPVSVPASPRVPAGGGAPCR